MLLMEEKPQKKKAKTRMATDTNIDEAVADVPEKRKKRVSFAEDPAEWQRKRVKSK